MSNRPISDQDTPDPWMIPWNGKFYLTFTLGNRVEVWCSTQMEDFRNCEKSVVWQPPPGHPWSADIWAPELHHLGGTWYIYFCGAPPNVGNPGHRTLILRSNSANPLDPSDWNLVGPLSGLPDDQWSIDATVFTINGNDLYCCYSGWPLGDHSDTQQDLFLVRMYDPEHVDPTTLVCISKAEHPWERPDGGKRGVNEGPTFVSIPPCHHHPQGLKGIVYSAHGSWTHEYKLGILALIDPSNPCNEKSWCKRPVPLLIADESRGGPFGPGHASFINSPYNDGRLLCIYHGTERKDEGWNNRKARVMSLGYDAFTSGAHPVCCAGSSQQHIPAPTSSSSNPGNNQSHGNYGAKIGQEIEKRIPGQYRGYFEKAKKFF